MKRIIAILVCVLLISAIPFTASAKSVSYAPYQGYEYNEYDESTAAPIAYLADKIYDGGLMGLDTELSAPSDMLYRGNSLYVLDSGNGRIVELDATTLKSKNIYTGFKTADGEEKSIEGAMGFALDASGEHFYIANTADCEVLKVTRDGLVTQVLERPDSALLDTDAQFLVEKIVIDNKNRVYVLAKSINLGAFVFDEDGNFMRFFGSNPIVATAEVVRDYILKQFMTKEQRKGLERITPTIFSNFDVDEYGFLYTVTANTKNTAQKGMVRRLNYTGNDILAEDIIFGDLEWDRVYSTGSLTTSFCDVDIDSDGFINLLDSGRGRVFQYNTEGQLLGEFGSFSEQIGGFETVSAIETIGSTVFVLDSSNNNLTVFKPTEYGSKLREAFLMMGSTETEKSYELWTDILKMNTNSKYPYYGIGMVMDARGEYKEAMNYFKLAGAREEYSKALREYRQEYISNNALLLVLCIVAIIAVIVVIARFIKKKSVLVEGTAFSALETKYMFPIYTCIHPADGFDQFKTRKIASLRMSAILVALWFFLNTAKFFYTGYTFNKNRSIDYELVVTLFSTVGLFVLFVVANWSVCTIMNGKGTFKDIIATCAYALVPYLIATFINILLSNVLTMEEAAFLGIFTTIGLIWSAMLLLVGLQSIHQYSFWGTIGSILLTILGMLIICFIGVLFYTLIQQAVAFIQSIITELSLR
ncbi:MAG: DUF1282 domain-containing protein [Ruminococcaceae bacterium]|nr:DUF1282 domain-containing protein [Oscillospiraceae bacterium]